jgi:hypothetical protein
MRKPRRVYFIEAGEGGPIKIGVAADVNARLRDLQVANPVDLKLIVSIPGGYDEERALHQQFRTERVSGEWFRGNGNVRAFAESLIGKPEAEIVPIVKIAKPKATKRAKGQERRKRYTPEEWQSMFFVGDGESIYRTQEAEDALREREKLRGLR